MFCQSGVADETETRKVFIFVVNIDVDRRLFLHKYHHLSWRIRW